jgi:HSP20 family protein
MSEIGDFSIELRQFFSELDRAAGSEGLTGECAPPLDVRETDEHIEITMDLPGAAPTAIRILVKGKTLLVAGEKASRRGRGNSTFHLVERSFGRFARAVPLPAACDAGRARATYAHGELRITLPKIKERRGRAIEVRLES